MENLAEAVGTMEKLDVRSYNSGDSTHLTSVDAPAVPIFRCLAILVKTIVEYAFGMHIGFAVGWSLGLWVGHIYVENLEPLYFSDLNELTQWRLMPYDFARNVAIIGVVAGAIAIAVINSKLLSHPKASDTREIRYRWGIRD